MIIIKVSTRRTKPQRKVASAPRSVKVLKACPECIAMFGPEQRYGKSAKPYCIHVELEQDKLNQQQQPKPQTSRIVRQIRNVRPLTPATALFAWNALFQTGVA